MHFGCVWLCSRDPKAPGRGFWFVGSQVETKGLDKWFLYVVVCVLAYLFCYRFGRICYGLFKFLTKMVIDIKFSAKIG